MRETDRAGGAPGARGGVCSGAEDGAPEAAPEAGRPMSADFPRELAIKIDNLLYMIAAGRIVPDPFDLLAAAATLRAHGELVRADRCVAIARRLLPNLGAQPD